jgi:hypothetical protein
METIGMMFSTAKIVSAGLTRVSCTMKKADATGVAEQASWGEMDEAKDADDGYHADACWEVPQNGTSKHLGVRPRRSLQGDVDRSGMRGPRPSHCS